MLYCCAEQGWPTRGCLLGGPSSCWLAVLTASPSPPSSACATCAPLLPLPTPPRPGGCPRRSLPVRKPGHWLPRPLKQPLDPMLFGGRPRLPSPLPPLAAQLVPSVLAHLRKLQLNADPPGHRHCAPDPRLAPHHHLFELPVPRRLHGWPRAVVAALAGAALAVAVAAWERQGQMWGRSGAGL